MDYRGLLRGVVTYFTRTTASCLDVFIQSTPSYQRRLDEHDQRYRDVIRGQEAGFRDVEASYQGTLRETKRRLASAEQRATFHADRALEFQSQIGALALDQVILAYRRVADRLDRVSQPCILLYMGMVIHINRRIKRETGNLSLHLLGEKIEYQTPIERDENPRVTIGEHLYAQRKRRDTRYRGVPFSILHLEYLGKKPDVLEKGQSLLPGIVRTVRERLKGRKKELDAG